MEQNKNDEMISEIPPIFNMQEDSKILNKSVSSVLLQQLIFTAAIIIILIIFNVFFPEIYNVFDIKINEKLVVSSLLI